MHANNATEVVESQHRLLQMAFKERAIPKELYFKGLILVAYEYAHRNLIEDALAAIAPIERSYYTSTVITQMEEDKDFHEIAAHLAELLGYSFEVTPTQRPANA
jgi:hypothetical protein